MKVHQQKKLPQNAGITILEVLIALAIIALIAAVAAPRLIGYVGSAKSEAAQLQIRNIKTALDLYYIDTGRYPNEVEGLNALVSNIANDSKWNGPYLTSSQGLVDPWEREYLFTAIGDNASPTVYSLGRDGVEGGSGEDGDVLSN